MNSSRFFDDKASQYSIRTSFICKELINKEYEKRLKPQNNGNNINTEDK